jgi:hypothetical protein
MEENVRLSMNVVETDGRHSDPDAINKLHAQYQKKEIAFKDYLARVRALGGDVLFGNVNVEADETECKTVETLMGAYKKGELSLHEMRAKIEDLGAETSFWDWEFDKNPEFEAHESKFGATWNPHYSKKGGFMQHVTKRVLIKMVYFVYKSILKYDKAAFTFSDPRLVYLRNSVDKYITNNLTVQYKKDLVQKLTDCALFMLKEDVYYRVLVLKMINETPREFEITKDEMYFFNREVPKNE